MFNEPGLAEYCAATTMADAYERETANIRRLALELDASLSRLRDTFKRGGNVHDSDFELSLQYHQERFGLTGEDMSEVIDKMKRAAWAALVSKLDIRKLMSAAAQRKLDDQLEGRNRYGETVPPLPDITADNIMEVLAGLVSSAGDFLEDKIREEYQFWKPYRDKYATDDPNRLAEKLIKGYMVRLDHRGVWECDYDRRAHVIALDAIMHMLDGAGIPEGHDGDLVTAIRSSGKGGKGESKYFKFACFHNGNLHLRFKRLDLLALVNQVGAGGALPQARPERRGTTAV